MMRGALFSLLLLALPAAAFACSCEPMTREQSEAAAAAVFKGRVVSVKKTPRGTIATIAVEEVTKGRKTLQKGKTVKMRSNHSSASCGIEFEQGKSMNFAGDYREGRMRGNSCGQQGLNPPPTP